MNVEFEVKEILRGAGTKEFKANKICSFTIFNKQTILDSFKLKKVSEMYKYICKK